jgi:hypothetical protein
MAVQSLVSRAARPFGIEPYADLKVADPEGWLRGPWHRACESALLSSRFLERGLVVRDVLGEIWNSHLGGANHTRQLSVLLATEFFARCMIDGEVA